MCFSDYVGRHTNKPLLKKCITAKNIKTDEVAKYCGLFSAIDENPGDLFVCGVKSTLADCSLAPALERYTLGYFDDVPSEVFGNIPVITRHLTAFKALPQVLAYQQV